MDGQSGQTKWIRTDAGVAAVVLGASTGIFVLATLLLTYVVVRLLRSLRGKNYNSNGVISKYPDAYGGAALPSTRASEKLLAASAPPQAVQLTSRATSAIHTKPSEGSSQRPVVFLKWSSIKVRRRYFVVLRAGRSLKSDAQTRVERTVFFYSGKHQLQTRTWKFHV